MTFFHEVEKVPKTPIDEDKNSVQSNDTNETITENFLSADVEENIGDYDNRLITIENHVVTAEYHYFSTAKVLKKTKIKLLDIKGVRKTHQNNLIANYLLQRIKRNKLIKCKSGGYIFCESDSGSITVLLIDLSIDSTKNFIET